MRSPLRRERLTERQQSPERLEALSDGIFAVAMTLLVLGLGVDAHEATAASAGADLVRALVNAGIAWKFLFFLASFAVTSFFWVGHLLIYWTIERVDRILAWINIASFIPIVLVPFTTQLVGAFPHATFAGTLYVLDIVAAALTVDATWFYAVRAQHVAERTPPELVRAISRRLLFVTALFVVAAAVAPFFPYYSIGAVLLAMFYVTLTTGTRLLVD